MRRAGAGLRGEVETALADRLAAVAAAAGIASAIPGRLPARAAAVADWAASGEPGAAWLGFVAFAGRFPEPREFAALRRELLLAAEPLGGFLAATRALAHPASGALRRIRIVADRALADVGHTASTEHNTGIQRVVRRTLPHWDPAAVELVGWTADGRGFRVLDAAERGRVLSWGSHAPAARTTAPDDLIVPWRTDVLLPEVAEAARCGVLACLAAESGNRVGLIGYDLIPLVSADLVDPRESDRTGHYLEIVARASAVAAISESAAGEFRGFGAMLAAQGLAGPEVHAVPLGEEPLPNATPESRPDGLPLVLCVGSHEPRKNQTAVLAAGRILHREGVAFRLVFVGGGNRVETAPFDRDVARLQREGMAVETHRRLSDSDLAALYAAARCTVMVSLHEGYGIPVVESLGKGVPALTSDYGSLAEIAAGGGCVTVDPRDPDAIAAGMRALVTDDALVARLRAEAAARPARGWADFAGEAWIAMTGGTR